jgi:hydrogenase nickel incorporation protein HypB
MEERLNQILTLALKHHVTDIHLNVQGNRCEIEMRVNGRIRRVRAHEDDIRFFHYLMYRANLDLSASLEPQTGRFEADVNGQKLALRFATVSSYKVTSGVLRILNNHGALTIPDLSADPHLCNWLSSICSHRSGLYVFSGPTGSGKTTTLLALNKAFDGRLRWGVMEADIDSAVDADTMLAAGVPSVQLHTGGMCHLDADMTRQGIRALDMEDAELIVLENIGNLVCPAEFDTGAAINMTILSVPEGDDKPAKYPLMYETCDMLVVNKIDTLPIFDFDKEKMEGYARARNPKIEIFYISAKTGEGVQELADALVKKVKEWNAT